MSNLAPVVATVFHSDTLEHLMTSAFLVGDVVNDYGSKSVIVSYYSHQNEKEVEENGKKKKITEDNESFITKILDHFKIPDANRIKSKHDSQASLASKLQDTADKVISKGVHVIFMPNSNSDLNEKPQEITKLVTLDGTMACQAVAVGYIRNKFKPKDDAEFAKKIDENRISPMWKYQFTDFPYIDNQVKQNSHGLKELFYPENK